MFVVMEGGPLGGPVLLEHVPRVASEGPVGLFHHLGGSDLCPQWRGSV